MSDDNILPISAVEFDPQNARVRTERSSYMIKESLQKFGPLRSLVGQRLPDGRIIVRAGNGTLEEAGQIGIDKVRIIERRPDELVVVVADDLDESAWKSYAIADNRTSDLSDWDTDVLAELAAEGVEVGDWFLPEEMAAWDVEGIPGDVDPRELWEGMPEFQQENQDCYMSIKVNIETPDDLYKLAELLGQKITENTKWINYPYRPPEDLTQYTC